MLRLFLFLFFFSVPSLKNNRSLETLREIWLKCSLQLRLSSDTVGTEAFVKQLGVARAIGPIGL